jgi:hypothetical protein
LDACTVLFVANLQAALQTEGPLSVVLRSFRPLKRYEQDDRYRHVVGTTPLTFMRVDNVFDSLPRPLVIWTCLDGIRETVLFRVDSGTNTPVTYGKGKPWLARANVEVLKRLVTGVEQDFAVLPPRNVSVGR